MIKKITITVIIFLLSNILANAQLARVYIVDNKKTTVYHTSRQCKLLNNAENPIKEISIQEAQSIYRKCHFCKNAENKKNQKEQKHNKKKSKKNKKKRKKLEPCPQINSPINSIFLDSIFK